jgi:ABC-type multidrug transport system fused ATPase/permease subunit
MALLQRMWDPVEGRVTLDGHDLRDITLESLRRNIGVVFQESMLFNRTIRENLTVGRADATQEELERACRMAEAHDFIIRQPGGYDTIVGERGASLSGGQRQRLALARAVVRRPRLLVLDDATSAVDPAVEARILDALRTADRPVTVVVVAYRQATIALADEVVWLADGRLVDRGSHAELLARVPGYAQLVRAYQPPGPDAADRQPAEARA